MFFGAGGQSSQAWLFQIRSFAIFMRRRSFALFCALLLSLLSLSLSLSLCLFACLRLPSFALIFLYLRSFALICMFLHLNFSRKLFRQKTIVLGEVLHVHIANVHFIFYFVFWVRGVPLWGAQA